MTIDKTADETTGGGGAGRPLRPVLAIHLQGGCLQSIATDLLGAENLEIVVIDDDTPGATAADPNVWFPAAEDLETFRREHPRVWDAAVYTAAVCRLRDSRLETFASDALREAADIPAPGAADGRTPDRHLRGGSDSQFVGVIVARR